MTRVEVAWLDSYHRSNIGTLLCSVASFRKSYIDGGAVVRPTKPIVRSPSESMPRPMADPRKNVER